MKPRILEGALAAAGVGLMVLGIFVRVSTLAAHARLSAGRAESGQAAGAPRSSAFAIVDARVFDGRNVLERATVLVESGTIRAVGANIDVPNGTPVVNAYGKTLLPGLIDSHTSWTEEDPLSERERQVLRLAADGRSGTEIAEALKLSEGTVRNYLSEAISKLGAKNRIEAARIARARGWL
jgi:two-component system response regulator DesR